MKRLSAIALALLCVLLLVAALAPGVAWRLAVPRPLGVVILDKTVPDTTYRGHRAVVWLLNHLKLVHPGSHTSYDVAGDYVGFVPLTNRAWSVRPFPQPLGENRVVYIADTYGVTASDLGESLSGGSARMLYGGLTAADLDVLEAAARSGVTLIGEFNTAAEPTVDSVRVRAERLFGFRWTGWTGRRSSDLRRDLPPWAAAAWERQSGQPWGFEGEGFLLVHRDGRLAVLTGRDFRGWGLDIVPTTAGVSLGLREAPSPQGWFDVVEAAGAAVLAVYAWHLTPRGDSLFQTAGIPQRAGAVFAYKAGAARTYYLAGDFSNLSRVPAWTRLRWGASLHRAVPGWWLPPQESFFWRGYVPLLTRILDWASGTSGTSGS